MAFQQMTAFAYAQLNTAQRDSLDNITGLTIFNLDTSNVETWLNERWGATVTAFGYPNAGDALTWDPLAGFYVPTPTSTPLLSKLRVYNDATDILQVKRIYKSNVLTNTSGLTTATMTPGGVHSLTGAVNVSYRVQVDSAGTLDGHDATIKWSEDGGGSFPYTGIPVMAGVAGRQTFVPIVLSNDVTILFTQGNFTAGDHWDFIAIASGNQVYDLSVDTTNSVVQVGNRVEIGDSSFKLYRVGSTQSILQWGTDPAAAAASLTWTADAATGGTLAYSDSLGSVWQIVTGAGSVVGKQFLVRFMPVVLGAIATPTTPAATFASLYQKADKPYWLDSAGVESILPQAAKAESITGTWTFTAATFTAATITTLTAPTIAGATTASGAWSFTSAGTAVAITNNATIGGTLGVTGTTTVGTINGSAGTMTALTITTLTSTTATITTINATTIAGVVTASGAWTFSAAATALTVTNNALVSGTLTAVTFASTTATITTMAGSPNFTGTPTFSAANITTLASTSITVTNLAPTNIKDGGSTTRIVLSVGSPHITMTGNVSISSSLTVPSLTASTELLVPLIYDGAGNLKISLAAATPHITLTGDVLTTSFVQLTNVAKPANPSAGLIDMFAFAKATGSYQDTPRWLDSSGHDSGTVMRALNLQPMPLFAPTQSTASYTISTILGAVGLVVVPCGIVLHTLSYDITAAAVGSTGLVRMALYTESGALITGTNVTDNPAAAVTGVRTVTLGADVYLPAGVYYQFMCIATAYGTTDPKIGAYTLAGTAALYQAVGSVGTGTVVCTAGAAPSPLGTVSAVNSSTPILRWVGAAT